LIQELDLLLVHAAFHRFHLLEHLGAVGVRALLLQLGNGPLALKLQLLHLSIGGFDLPLQLLLHFFLPKGGDHHLDRDGALEQ